MYTAYAYHCQYLLTLDENCAAKAIKIFMELKIETEVLRKDQFDTIKKSD